MGRDGRLKALTCRWLWGLALVGGLAPGAAGGEFAGLTPGVSTAADATRVLGEPVQRGVSLVFSGEKYAAASIAVEIEKDTGVILSIVVAPKELASRADMVRWLSLGAPAYKESAGGEDVELFVPQFVQLRVKDGKVTELAHIAPKAVLARRGAEAKARLRKGDAAGAVAELTSLRKLAPADEETLFALAEALHEAGSDPQALNVLTQGLAIAPENERAALLRTCIEAGLWASDPGWVGARIGGCCVTTVFVDTPAAKAGLREGDQIAEVDGHAMKDSWELREYLGAVRVGQDIALKLLRGGAAVEARMTASDRRDYFAGRPAPTDDVQAGIVLAEMGHAIDAEKRLRKAVAENPAPRARYEFAQAAECLDYERGIQEWRTFQQQAGGDVPAAWRQHAQDELKAMEEGLEAYKMIKRAVDTGDWEYHKRGLPLAARERIPVASYSFQLARGDCLKHNREYGSAVSAYLAASRLWPDLTGSWYSMGDGLENYDFAKARAACIRYLRATAGSEKLKDFRQKALERKARVEVALARKVQGDLKAAKKQWDGALADYQAVAEAAPKSTEVLLCRIRTLAAMGRADEAWELSQKVSEHGHSPASGLIHAYLGSVHYKAGRFQQSLDEYVHAWGDSGDVPRYLYFAAMGAEKCLSKAGATAAWFRYLKHAEGRPEEAERLKTVQEHLAKLK